MTSRLLRTQEVAEQLATSPEYVRDHAADLGGIRLGDKNSPLRFEQARVDEFLERQRVAATQGLVSRRRPGPARNSGVVLLPLPRRAA